MVEREAPTSNGVAVKWWEYVTIPFMADDTYAAHSHNWKVTKCLKINSTYHNKCMKCKGCKATKNVKEKHSFPAKWKKGTRYVGPGGVYYQEYYRYCTKGCGYYQVKKVKL